MTIPYGLDVRMGLFHVNIVIFCVSHHDLIWVVILCLKIDDFGPSNVSKIDDFGPMDCDPKSVKKQCRKTLKQ